MLSEMHTAIENISRKQEQKIRDGEYRQPCFDLVHAGEYNLGGRRLRFNSVQRIVWQFLYERRSRWKVRVVLIGYFDENRTLFLSPSSETRTWSDGDVLVIMHRTQK